MDHSGGTKFYEVITLTNAQTGASIVFNRWGKIAQAKVQSGGEVKQAAYASVAAAQKAHQSKVAEKGKRDYRSTLSDFALHNLHSAGAVTQAEIEPMLSKHFGPAMVPTVFEALGISKDPVSAPKPKEPEVHIDRGNDWGAWA